MTCRINISSNGQNTSTLSTDVPDAVQFIYKKDDITISEYYDIAEMRTFNKYKSEIWNMLKQNHPEDLI